MKMDGVMHKVTLIAKLQGQHSYMLTWNVEGEKRTDHWLHPRSG